MTNTAAQSPMTALACAAIAVALHIAAMVPLYMSMEKNICGVLMVHLRERKNVHGGMSLKWAAVLSIPAFTMMSAMKLTGGDPPLWVGCPIAMLHAASMQVLFIEERSVMDWLYVQFLGRPFRRAFDIVQGWRLDRQDLSRLPWELQYLPIFNNGDKVVIDGGCYPSGLWIEFMLINIMADVMSFAAFIVACIYS